MLGSSKKIETQILKVHHSPQAAQVGIRSSGKAIGVGRGPPRKTDKIRKAGRSPIQAPPVFLASLPHMFHCTR